ncbi:MAG: TetR-like C-terminal domain-containing protein, partial [Candidatus Korobacteraceae bacterium]
ELLEEFRKRLLRPRRQEAYETLRRGIERGELPQNLDLDLVLDTLYGAMYMRFLIRHDELSENYIEEVCRMVLEGATRQGSSARHNGAKKNGAAAARSRNQASISQTRNRSAIDAQVRSVDK